MHCGPLSTFINIYLYGEIFKIERIDDKIQLASFLFCEIILYRPFTGVGVMGSSKSSSSSIATNVLVVVMRAS